jgi:hypothetical protein
MNSTDKTLHDLQLNDFFNTVIIPLSKVCAGSRKSYLALGIDQNLDSYFENPINRFLSRKDFERPCTENIDEYLAVLKNIWMNDGSLELIRIIEKLYSLREIFETQIEQDENVSSLTYPMF